MNIFLKLQMKSRTQKLKLFYDIFSPNEHMKILDIGGQINPGNTSSLQLIDSYKWKKNISVINIAEEQIQIIKKSYPEINAVVGDACKLPWPDNYFDIIYSNAVIEHVGGYTKQKQMASEIMRVGKAWFVTTPNRWFPFEFHIRLPFITWLPGHLYNKVASLLRYNHIKKKYTFNNSPAGLRLLTANDLRKLFDDSNVVKQKITILPETLIVVKNN